MKRKVLIIFFISVFYFSCGNNNKSIIEATGTIEATNIILSSKNPGEVIRIIKEEGSPVYENDTILVIDHSLLDLQLEQALAQETIAKAQLDLLRKGARSEDIKQAENNVIQAEVNYSQAKTDYERMLKLHESNSVPDKQMEDARTKMNTMEAQYKSAKENLIKLKNLFRPEEIVQAEANLKKLSAGVKLLKKNITDCYIISPLSGTLVKKFVEQGESVAPMTNLVKITDLNKMKLTIYISTEDIPKVKLGGEADVKIDAFTDKIFKGKIVYISPDAEFTPKNIQTKDERTKLVFAVKILIDNPNGELKAGLPADAIIHLK